MRKTWVLCSLYFVMGAGFGAAVVMHIATQHDGKWLAEAQQSNANWKKATDAWQVLYNGCAEKFNVATVLYEPRPAQSLQVPIDGGALQLSVGLAGVTSSDLTPAWYIPAQVTPRSAKTGLLYQWIDMPTGQPRGTLQLAPAAEAR